MNNITLTLEKWLLPISTKISENKTLSAISKGFMRILPVTMIGSIFYLIANFPIPGWVEWINQVGIVNYILIPYHVTIGLFAVYTVFSVAYSYIEEEDGDALAGAIIATISFFVITPYGVGESGGLNYAFDWLSSKGLFVAMITAILVAKLCTFVVKRNWTIKMPEGVPPFVEKSFGSIIPGFISASMFAAVAYVFSLTSFHDVHQFVFQLLQTPLYQLGGSFTGYIVATILIQLLWWFGIHGFNVVMSIMMPIFIGIDMARLAGETTNPIGMSLMTVVGQSTIACCLVLIFFCKSQQLKQIGKLGAPAAIFNIGEPIVFGVPNVLNPYMFIPTVILIPFVTNVFFYFGFVSGILPPLSGAQVSMQVPVILYGIVQGNWMVAIWQALAIPLAMVLYLPFIKMYDKTLVARESVHN